MKKSLLLVGFLLPTACAPTPEIEWVTAPLDQAQKEPASRSKIKKGDVVRVVIKEGRKKDMFEVDEVEEAAFLGVSLVDHRTYHVHYSALESMEVRRWGVGWTLLDVGN